MTVCKWCGYPIEQVKGTTGRGFEWYHTERGFWCFTEGKRHAPAPDFLKEET